MPKSKKEAEPLPPKEETGLPNDLDPTVSHTELEPGGDDAAGPGYFSGSQTDPELDELDAARQAELAAGLVQAGGLPQLDPELVEGPVESGADLELGELVEPPPQTDFENPGDQLPEGTPGAVPQTGREKSTDKEFEGAADPLSQTGTETAPDGQPATRSSGDLDENSAGSQTDFENPVDLSSEGAPGSLSQTDPDQGGGAEEDQAPSGSDADALPTPSQPKRRAAGKRSAKKEAAELNAAGEPESGDDAAQTESEKPKRKAPARRRGQKVVSIDAERTVETAEDKLRNDLLDLVESMKGKKILAGAIQGVERAGDNPNLIYAVVYHGNFKVIIPSLEAVEEPEDYRDQPKSDVLHYLLNKRLGAEVDYIVKGIDQETGVAVASRLDAMAQKRKEYYFKTDRDGNYQLYEGVCAEARVVSVIRAGVFVDLFGAECYVPLKELSYQRWIDAAAHYQPGQRVLVKIMEVDRSDRTRLRVLVSVKQAGENPYEQALKRFTVGSRYVGTVSLVDLTGVFVALDGGIDCLCTYPKRGRPPRGARVTVRILGIDHETNRIWGVITHMSTLR